MASHPGKDLVCCPLSQPPGQPRSANPKKRALAGGLEHAAPGASPAGGGSRPWLARSAGSAVLTVRPSHRDSWGTRATAAGPYPRWETETAGRGLPRRPHSPPAAGPRCALWPRGQKGRGAGRTPGSWLEALTPGSPHSDLRERLSLKSPKLEDIREWRCLFSLPKWRVHADPTPRSTSRLPRGPERFGGRPSSDLWSKTDPSFKPQSERIVKLKKVRLPVLHCPALPPPFQARGGALAVLDSELCWLKFSSPTVRARARTPRRGPPAGPPPAGPNRPPPAPRSEGALEA